MIIKRLGGLLMKADTTLESAEQIQCLFETSAAISVGTVVGFTATGNPDGKLISAATVANDHLVCGVYEGNGGKGADTTTSNASGKDALSGDLVFVTTYGVAKALYSATTTATVACELGATGKYKTLVTALAAGLVSPAVNLEDASTSGVYNTFVRYL